MAVPMTSGRKMSVNNARSSRSDERSRATPEIVTLDTAAERPCMVAHQGVRLARP